MRAGVEGGARQQAVGRQRPAGRPGGVSPAARVAGGPTHEQGGGLGAEERKAAAAAGLARQTPGRRLGSGEQAGQRERVGQRAVAQGAVE